MQLRHGVFATLTGLAVSVAGQAAEPNLSSPAAAGDKQQVAQAIATGIARAVPDRGYSVTVEYQDGVATLKGTAANPTQVMRITEAAKRHPAVTKTVNQMAVARRSSALRQTAFQEPVQPQAPPPAAAPDAGQMLAPAAPQYTWPSGASPQYDMPFMPYFAWPAQAPYPNYSAVTYPKKYAKEEWPYLGPFHPYPEAPLDWRKVTSVSFAGLKPIAHPGDPPLEWQHVSLSWENGRWYYRFQQPWWSPRLFLMSIGMGDYFAQTGDAGQQCGGICNGGPKVHFHAPYFTHLYRNY